MASWRGTDKAGRSLTVRQATARDAGRYLAHLARLVTETPFMLQGPEDALPSTGEQEAWLDRLPSGGAGLCLLATQPVPGTWFARERVIGSLTLVSGRTRRVQHHAQLGMGVERPCWGQGIGSRLLDVALAWARANPGISRVSLQVYVTNRSALALYRSRGFVEEGMLECEACDGAGWIDLVGMGLDVRGLGPRSGQALP